MDKYQLSIGVNSPLKKGYKQTEVGVIPEDWKVKKLGEIGVFKKGKGIKKEAVLLYGLPCIRYGEIYTHHNEYIKKFYSFINIKTAKEGIVNLTGVFDETANPSYT